MPRQWPFANNIWKFCAFLLYARQKYERKGEYELAAGIYKEIGMENKAKENYIKTARRQEARGDNDWAGENYEKAGMINEAREAYLKGAKDAEARKNPKWANELYKKAENLGKSQSKTLDSIVTSILAFGGIGLIYSFFSKPNVISAQNVQLAPPFPNYMVYVFAAMLIGGIGYFLVKKLKK